MAVRQRRSVRLPGFDYSQPGGYFVTICTHQRAPLLGRVTENGDMHLNQCGEIVQQGWLHMGDLRDSVILDDFVIMPNHMHALLFIGETRRMRQASSLRAVGATLASPDASTLLANSLSAIIGGFKSAVSRRIHRLPAHASTVIWQRSFHDVVIRNAKALDRLRQYIQTNPTRWAEDRYYADYV